MRSGATARAWGSSSEVSPCPSSLRSSACSTKYGERFTTRRRTRKRRGRPCEAGPATNGPRSEGEALDATERSKVVTLNPRSFELSVEKGVATITLSRPERLNALTFEVYGELASTFRSLE